MQLSSLLRYYWSGECSPMPPGERKKQPTIAKQLYHVIWSWLERVTWSLQALQHEFQHSAMPTATSTCYRKGQDKQVRTQICPRNPAAAADKEALTPGQEWAEQKTGRWTSGDGWMLLCKKTSFPLTKSVCSYRYHFPEGFIVVTNIPYKNSTEANYSSTSLTLAFSAKSLQVAF